MSRYRMRFMLYDLTIPPGISMISIEVSFVDIQAAGDFWYLNLLQK